MGVDLKMVHNCPNCGAPIKHYYNHNCEYCGTFLHNTDEDILKLNNCDVRIDNVYIEQSMLEPGYELTIIGTSIPRFNYWNEGYDNLIVTNFSDVKKVGYKVRLDYKFIAQNRFDKEGNIIEYVIYHLPPAFREYQGNINKVIDCLYNFLQKGVYC